MYQRELQGYEKAIGSDNIIIYVPTLNTIWNVGLLFERQANLHQTDTSQVEELFRHIPSLYTVYLIPKDWNAGFGVVSHHWSGARDGYIDTYTFLYIIQIDTACMNFWIASGKARTNRTMDMVLNLEPCKKKMRATCQWLLG